MRVPSAVSSLVIGLTVLVFLGHLYAIMPLDGYMLLDEPYYTLVAHYVLTQTVCTPPVLVSPYSCNLEHPPLAKVLIAAGIAIFGDTNWGWRMSSVLLGTISVPLLYVIVYRLSEDWRLALLSATFLALDSLFFSESSLAMLDVPEVAFALAAYAIYLQSTKIGFASACASGGLFMGLAVLSKETGVFLLGALATYQLFLGDGPTWSQRARGAGLVVLTAFAVFAVGLQVYDSTLTKFPFFTDQIGYILSFGSAFRSPSPLPILSAFSGDQFVHDFVIYAEGCTSCARSGPFDWLTFYYPIQVLSLPLQTFSLYIVADTPMIWTVYAWVPLAIVALKAIRVRKAYPGGRVAGFALIWFLWNYLPYVVLYLFGRYMYVWYLIPAVPAIAVGAALLVTRGWFPRWLMVVYIAILVGWFVYFFPNKDFLSALLAVGVLG